MLLTTTITAESLGQEGEEPVPVERPGCAALIDMLVGETSMLGDLERQTTDPATAEIIRAQINVRRTSIELLSLDPEVGDAAVAMLAGLHLADARSSIDDAIDGIDRPAGNRPALLDVLQWSVPLAYLQAFNEHAAVPFDWTPPLSSEFIDDALRVRLEPLARAIGVSPLDSSWPRTTTAGLAVESDTPPEPPDDLDVVNEALATTRAAAARIVHPMLRRAAERFTRQLTEIETDPLTAGSITAMQSQLESIRSSLDALVRMQSWIDMIPPASDAAGRGDATEFERGRQQIERRCGQLAQRLVRDRANTLVTIDALHESFERYGTFPDESAAIETTVLNGGLGRELRYALARARTRWGVTWIDGRDDAASRAPVEALRRLCVNFGRLQPGSQSPTVPAALPHWSGIRLSDRRTARAHTEVFGRLKLAIAAAANDDYESVTRHNEILDRYIPEVQLAYRVWLALGRQDYESDPDAAMVLADIVVRPGPDAWLVTHRAALARLSVAAMEEDAAILAGDTDQVDRYADVTRDLFEMLASTDQ